jgi:hypothetical protein
MGKSSWFILAIAVLAASFLYEPETQKTIIKRSPLEKRSEDVIVHKTVGRETTTMWTTLSTPMSPQATRTETITHLVTETVFAQ